MTGTDVAPKFSIWTAAEHSIRIEYSATVLEEIRQVAVEGYHRVPHGGVETGGILFGTHENGVVRIQAWRPIDCEYARGPSFLLSEKDEAALVETLKSWDGDPRISAMEPVGWYRAHTRSEVLLSESDLRFFDRFFPRPWQVALIVRPASFAPTRAGFFFREPDGSVRAESSYGEFVMSPFLRAGPPADAQPPPRLAATPPAAAAPEAPPPGVESLPGAGDGTHQAAGGEPAAVEPEPLRLELPRAPGAQRRWFGASVILLWAAAVMLMAAAGLGYWFIISARGLSLSAAQKGGELLISWDRAARPIRRATGGLIEIDDHGVHTEVMLTAADLRSGNVSYARQSGDVRVRLMIYLPGSSPVAESTRFLRPEESHAPPAPSAGAAKVEPPREPETQQPRVEPAPTAATPSPLQAYVPPPAGSKPPAAPARRVKTFRPPRQTSRQTSAAIPTITPPKIDTPPAIPQAGALPSLLGPALPAPAPPPHPKRAAPLTSGKIIWTGKLPKNGRLIVEGNHASAGAISGALPAQAARVTAYPGDLTAAGITFFTSDPRYSRPVTEAAGADNGWNATTYTWNPKRAGAIKVIEQPRPQNGYRLVLESDSSKLPVIVLQWRTEP